jgi:hypothetical protein
VDTERERPCIGKGVLGEEERWRREGGEFCCDEWSWVIAEVVKNVKRDTGNSGN